MTHPAGYIDPAELLPDVEAYRAGDAEAGDRLCRSLAPVVRLATARMLGDADAEVEDVVQEALVACLGYLAGEREFAGDPVRLAVTIARNRCRDHLRHRSRRPHVAIEPLENWLSDSHRSPLDDLAEREVRRHLQAALDRLGTACRALLKALYVDDRTPEEVRHDTGLGTVQGVYYRRGVCLDQLKKVLQRRWRFGSGDDGSPATHDGRGPEGAVR